jgi:hypothetical protein
VSRDRKERTFTNQALHVAGHLCIASRDFLKSFTQYAKKCRASVTMMWICLLRWSAPAIVLTSDPRATSEVRGHAPLPADARMK